ncbi:unnamed protein product [Rotaria socialis]|uniref:Uncharacterized protein n=1 Tax=Rotaria socialis TaxID=392032 RepID=A0A818HP01_9BILA|nr:unnamed protein product [Rotaria socialis]CAF3438782.1 unnamed protein product [Rotaria socialis]CAF3506426.1 unnamed protein product [Rotaria socialis]CAF3672467.1 unnamed protein product [Rotaria socialis]CAF4225848.1 unnamed protein product [Rotaria socialis]
MPPKKATASKCESSLPKTVPRNAAKPPQKVNVAKPTQETAAAAVVDKPEPPIVKQVKMKQVIPKEMEKLENLKKWPIIMDEVGNLKTFYRLNETVIDFTTPLTVQRVKVALQHVFFGLSFNPDGSINDHREYSIPNNVNRLVAIIMEENSIEKCVEELRKVCDQLHPELFDAVFVKADVKESGRDNLDRLFVMTKTPDEIRNADYYQFGAKCRTEVPFICVWITQQAEIPPAYDNLFGLRFKLNYD